MTTELKAKVDIWYPKNKDNLWKLGNLLIENLESILKEGGIIYFNIKSRVKELESIKTKIWKKWTYKEISDIEDICWIRITCFYEDDVEKIADLLCAKLIGLKKEIKEVSEADRFWYRWIHLTGKIPKDWKKVPTFSWLSEYTFEVQIRTVVTHAWAEIEHQLSYKWDIAIPESIRRELSWISQKLEEIDWQFIKIRTSLVIEKKRISKLITGWKDIKLLKWLEVDNYCLDLYLEKIFWKDFVINKEYNWTIIRICKDNWIDMEKFMNFIQKNEQKIQEFFKEYQESIMGSKVIKSMHSFIEAFDKWKSFKWFISINQFMADILMILFESKIITDSTTWKWKRSFCTKIKELEI